MRILVVRNDRLGDFMLAWPTLALLRQALPEAEIEVLVPPYTRPIAQLCPYINGVVEVPAELGTLALARQLRRHPFDALLTLYSTARVAAAGLLAGIPYRLAPATKAFQLLYNHRLRQRRSRSERPEWRYNLELAEQLLRDHALVPPAPTQPPLLRLPAADTAALRRRLCQERRLDPASRLLFLHPGSGGSAGSLQAAQWATLANAINPDAAISWVVTAGPGEEANATQVVAAIHNHPAILYSGGDLVALTRHLACADLLLAGSTGPLHLAGALDRPTAGFYPRHRSGNPLRWQTLNSPPRRLVFVPPPEAEPQAVNRIDLDTAAQTITQYLNHGRKGAGELSAG